jgi:hypothetical protein
MRLCCEKTNLQVSRTFERILRKTGRNLSVCTNQSINQSTKTWKILEVLVERESKRWNVRVSISN